MLMNLLGNWLIRLDMTSIISTSKLQEIDDEIFNCEIIPSSFCIKTPPMPISESKVK